MKTVYYLLYTLYILQLHTSGLRGDSSHNQSGSTHGATVNYCTIVETRESLGRVECLHGMRQVTCSILYKIVAYPC